MKKISFLFIILSSICVVVFAHSTSIDNTADSVIAKYIEMTGLNRLDIENVSFMLEQRQTTFIEDQKPYIIETYTIASPKENKYYSTIEGQFSSTSIFNGKDGWVESNDIIVEFNEDLKASTLMAIHYFKCCKYDERFYGTEYIGECTIEGSRVHKIKVKDKKLIDSGDCFAYFDVKTGLYVFGENIKDDIVYKTRVINYVDTGDGILIPTLVVECNGKVISILETFRIVLGYPLENIDFSREGVQHKFDAWEEYSKGLENRVSDKIKALKYFNYAIKANPNFIRAHEAKIDMLYDLERYTEALESCKILKGIHPENLEATRMEAFVLARLEQIEQARIANERYLAQLEEERQMREEELISEENNKKILALEEENRQLSLKLQSAFEENAIIESKALEKKEKKAKRKNFWNKFWKGIEATSAILNTAHNLLDLYNNQGYSNNGNYDYRGSYSAKSKLISTRTCPTCNGTGVNLLSKERPAFYTSNNISSTVCKYCNDITIHYHSECPTCRGKGEITLLN